MSNEITPFEQIRRANAASNMGETISLMAPKWSRSGADQFVEITEMIGLFSRRAAKSGMPNLFLLVSLFVPLRDKPGTFRHT